MGSFSSMLDFRGKSSGCSGPFVMNPFETAVCCIFFLNIGFYKVFFLLSASSACGSDIVKSVAWKEPQSLSTRL